MPITPSVLLIDPDPQWGDILLPHCANAAWSTVSIQLWSEASVAVSESSHRTAVVVRLDPDGLKALEVIQQVRDLSQATIVIGLVCPGWEALAGLARLWGADDIMTLPLLPRQLASRLLEWKASREDEAGMLSQILQEQA